MQQLQSAVIEQKTIWESITLVVALNLLYNNFEMTTALFFYSSNKDPKEIQQIVTLIEVANLAKQAVKAISDLAIIAKKK